MGARGSDAGAREGAGGLADQGAARGPTEQRAAGGGAVWITGVPASGKTTLARGLVGALAARGVATLWLDSDDLRAVVTPEASYTGADRDRFYALLGHVARLGVGGGVCVVLSATAQRARYREALRAQLAPGRFVEVALRCAPEALRGARDVKGLYARADAGEIERLPGVGEAFEASARAELELDTTARAPRVVQDEVLAWLDAHHPALTGAGGR